MLEEVLDALEHLGDKCICHRPFDFGDVGKHFKCVQHGKVIITQIEVTSMEDDILTYTIGLQEYA